MGEKPRSGGGGGVGMGSWGGGIRGILSALSYVKQQGASAFIRLKHIIEENGAIYKFNWERVNS